MEEQEREKSGPQVTGGGVWQRSDNSIDPNGVFLDRYSANGNAEHCQPAVFRDRQSGEPSRQHRHTAERHSG
jgi:hypothetical protein